MVGGRARDEAKSNNVMLPPSLSLFPALISNLDNKRLSRSQAGKKEKGKRADSPLCFLRRTDRDRERERAV